MHQNIRLLSLLSIFSLTLISLTGCGEKRVHVATISGAPGDEIAALQPINETTSSETSGLSEVSVDESALSSQNPAAEEIVTEPETSGMTNEPINMTHEPPALPSQDRSSDSSLTDTIMSEQESGLSGNGGSFAPLAEGQDISTQSSSLPQDFSSANFEDFREPVPAQHPSTALQDALTGEGLQPIPNSFQIAKAEPSDGLQERLNQIKQEELAAAAAGFEDVFFQFDSWTLTQKGKQSLQRTHGWFEQTPSSTLIIEGHADQRGTQAYNMVLAKKRAVAVQDYLSQLGIDASRMAVISYGKDKPFCQDATEVCHQLNRRGHLLIPNR